MRRIDIQIPELLSRCAIRELKAELERAFALDSGRVVVLAGGSQCFCKGMDLSADFGPGSEEEIAAFAACLELIRLGPKPVIAAVTGPAIAGGVGLAAAADIVVASPEATFSVTELLFGLLPAVILPYLFERLPKAKVRGWALSATTWTAAEAKASGLVDVVSASADLAVPLNLWTRSLMRAQGAGLWKRYTAEAAGLNLRRGVNATAGRLRDPKVIENIRNFIENEELPWIRMD